MRALYSQMVEGLYNDKLEVARSRFVLPALTVTFERGVIAFAVGIAVYFAWWTEPDWRVAMGLAAVTGAYAAWRRSGWSGMLALVMLGFAWAGQHTAFDNPNPLEREQRLRVTGYVTDVDTGGPMRRLVIKVKAVEPAPRSGHPETVRIRVGRNFPDVGIGDAFSVDAVVAPLPGPVVPDGYDPARRAFFGGLAGSGFAIGPPDMTRLELGAVASFRLSLRRWRQAIADRVLETAPEATAGLQAALLTGLRDAIPDGQTEALRASGLAHILAISGLHMGMVAFGVFAGVTALLAATPLSVSRDMRKPAALVSIIAATVYLGLSGASVATQRAYIMVVIAFLAVLLDRRALSLRSVAVAAALTLAFHPEALMSVGFQMSFAAVTALVIVYREWAERRPRQRTLGLRDRMTRYFGSLAGTSIVAGLATLGFGLFHFGRYARYSLLGNMAAMAFFPAVMLFGIIALLAMPLEWDAAPLAIMGYLLGKMLWVAEWVSGLPGAIGTVKASHPVALALYGLGFATASFATRRALMAGGSMMATALLVWSTTPTAQIRINADGRVSLRHEGQGLTSSTRADRYGREQFARGAGEPEIGWAKFRDGFATCDALACRFQLGGQWVSVVEEASEVPEACTTSDLVILPERAAGIVAKRNCGARLLDGPALEQAGGVHVKMGRTLEVRPILSSKRANRPWGRGR